MLYVSLADYHPIFEGVLASLLDVDCGGIGNICLGMGNINMNPPHGIFPTYISPPMVQD